MNTLEGLLAGIAADPLEETRWLVLADWLEEFDDPRRGELLRLHRKLLATCCEPNKYSERAAWQARIVELIEQGVHPCAPQKTLVLPGNVEMRFSFIPPGEFLMGSGDPEAQRDKEYVHRVNLTKGFYLGIYPVTQAQWQVVMGTAPSQFRGIERPVEQVSWEDCQAFCRKLAIDLKTIGKIRLPTEAEWEYACRSGSTTEYSGGDGEEALNKVGWFDANSGEETQPVGQLLANAWNLHDMHGNVWEWCNDGLRRYSSERMIDPIHSTRGSATRPYRGGGWNNSAGRCRSAFRRGIGQEYRSPSLGFRAALVLPG